MSIGWHNRWTYLRACVDANRLLSTCCHNTQAMLATTTLVYVHLTWCCTTWADCSW